MPVVDTEVVFALNPRDPKHQRALKLLGEVKGLLVPDTAVFEFQVVLQARGRSPLEVKIALLAVNEALARHEVEEVKTVSSTLLALQCELEESYGLSYFDSLLAASALAVDRHIVSDDEAFDRVPDLKRTPLSSRQ
jgi:predicted nucleic acid-binding protein